MKTHLFKPGFRISVLDACFIGIATVGALYAARFELVLGIGIAFVVAHFFLFCNVFRIARRLELIWASFFIVSMGLTMTTSEPGWSVSFFSSALLAIVVIAYSMRQPSYHGLGWKFLNPGLLQWWDAQ